VGTNVVFSLKRKNTSFSTFVVHNLHLLLEHHKKIIQLNTGMPDCPASGQSGTGLEKTNDAGTRTVPD
jgi:hypothetical protein